MKTNPQKLLFTISASFFVLLIQALVGTVTGIVKSNQVVPLDAVSYTVKGPGIDRLHNHDASSSFEVSGIVTDKPFCYTGYPIIESRVVNNSSLSVVPIGVVIIENLKDVVVPDLEVSRGNRNFGDLIIQVSGDDIRGESANYPIVVLHGKVVWAIRYYGMG